MVSGIVHAHKDPSMVDRILCKEYCIWYMSIKYTKMRIPQNFREREATSQPVAFAKRKTLSMSAGPKVPGAGVSPWPACRHGIRGYPLPYHPHPRIRYR